MNKELSYHKKKRNRNRNRSMLFRFLATVIVAMFAVAIFIGGLSIYEVNNYIQSQAQEFVNITCSNEGSKINDSLGNMEKSVKIMESYLMDFFESETDIADRAFQEQLVKNAEKIVKIPRTTQKRKNNVSTCICRHILFFVIDKTRNKFASKFMEFIFAFCPKIPSRCITYTFGEFSNNPRNFS